MAYETFGFDVQSQGVDLIDQIEAAMERLNQQVKTGDEMRREGLISTEQYLDALRRSEAQLARLQAAHKSLTDTQQAHNAALANAGSSMSAWSNVIQHATQAGQEHEQQIADMAALHQHLAAMEDRSGKEAAETAAEWASAGKVSGDAAEYQSGKFAELAQQRRDAADAAQQAAKDDAMLARQERALSDALESMAQHEATATTATIAHAAAKGGAAGSFKNFNTIVFQGTQAIEDMQYSIAGGVNNITYMASLMGAGAPVIVGLTLLGVLAKVASDHWGELVEAMSGDQIDRAASDIEGLKEAIKKLEDKPTKLAVDLVDLENARRRLDDLQDKLAAFESASKQLTDTQGKVAAGVREAVVEHAGGTDVESGTKNLANAIAEKRKSQGRFISPEDQKALSDEEASVKRMEVSAREPMPGDDSTTIAFRMRQAQEARQAFERHQKEAADRAMQGIEGNLIGGALKGIDANRAELLGEVEGDLPFFEERGIGSPFRAAMMTSSAAEVRAKGQEAIHLQREARRRQGERAIKEANDRRDREQAQATARHDAEVAREANEAKAEADRQRREREQEVNGLARKNAVAVQGGEGHSDLTAAVLRGLGEGQSPDALADALAPVAGQRLASVPGFDPADVEAVARKVVTEEIDRQAPRLAGLAQSIGGPRGQRAAASQLIDELNGRQFDHGLRADQAAENRADAMRLAQFRHQFATQGANPHQADVGAREALRVLNSTLDMNSAMMSGWAAMQNDWARVDRRVNGMQGQVNRLLEHQKNQTRVGSNLRPTMRGGG